MKNFLLIGAILGSLAVLGCGKSSSGEGSAGGTNPNPTPVGSGYAATPQPCNIQNQNQLGYPQTANCQNYNNWYAGWNPNLIQWSYGTWYWPVQYQVSSNNCGCPAGYYPVYGQTFGIACAPANYFSSNIVYFNYGWTGYSYWNYPQNGGWTNIPQIPYQGPANQNTCAQNTAQGCDVRLNTCPAGSTCQPVGGGSTIGLCVR
jgi:hypothetical protein